MKHVLPIFLAMGFAAFSAGAADDAAGSPFPTDAFATPEGKTVRFTCIKHASFRIEYDGLEIQVDPVGRGVPPATDYARFPKADLILITHEHFDHFDPEAIAALEKESTSICAPPSVREKLGRGRALANGGRFPWREDVSVEAVPAYNTTPGRETFHPKGRDNGYVLSLGSFRVYIAGDTEDIPEMAAIRDIDVAFLPCNQPYTMTPEQLASAARSLRPDVLFPYHFSETPVRRLVDLLAGSGIDLRLRPYR